MSDFDDFFLEEAPNSVSQTHSNSLKLMANNYFVIIGTKDNPIYEVEFGNIFKDGQSTRKEDLKHLNQFVIHSALDIVDEVVWGTQSNYLKIVDRYQMFSDDFCLFTTMDLVIIRAVIIRAIDMIVVWVMDALVSCAIDLLVVLLTC